MITPAKKKWIKMIHFAKNKINLTEEAYREVLHSCAGVTTSSALSSWQQYYSVMAAMNKLGFKNVPESAPHTQRDKFRISVKQENYIKGLWFLVSRNKDEESLNHFCDKIAGVKNLRFCSKNQGIKIITALREMATAQGINPDRKEG